MCCFFFYYVYSVLSVFVFFSSQLVIFLALLLFYFIQFYNCIPFIFNSVPLNFIPVNSISSIQSISTPSDQTHTSIIYIFVSFSSLIIYTHKMKKYESYTVYDTSVVWRSVACRTHTRLRANRLVAVVPPPPLSTRAHPRHSAVAVVLARDRAFRHRAVVSRPALCW